MCTSHQVGGGGALVAASTVFAGVVLVSFAALAGLFRAAASFLPVVLAGGLIAAAMTVFAWSRNWWTTPVLVPDDHQWTDICRVCNIAGCGETHVLADSTAHVGPVCDPCITMHGAPLDADVSAVVELARTAEQAVRTVDRKSVV